ncbi:ribosomal protein L19 [Burkholderia pseudomallei Pakistan 9]|nr:ribosomal protein L19 [Burkholderia pseudomallei Pakistan 9]
MNLIAKLEQEEIERALAGKTIPEFAPGRHGDRERERGGR